MNLAVAHGSSMGLTLWVVLLQITVLLSAAALVQRALARFPAARHAVLLWGILVAGIGPLFVLAAPHAGLRSRIALPSALHPPAFLDVNAQPRATGDPLLSTGTRLDSSARFSPAHVLLGLWAAGAIIMLVRFGRGLRVIIRIRRSASPVSIGSLEPRLRSLLRGRPPRVLASPRIAAPAVVGIFRPVVVLPIRLAVSLDERQLLQVLVHECAHALRHDPFTGLYQRLFGAIFWFHPLVHLVNRRLDRVREELCDNYVLRSAAPTDYARTLLTVAESFSPVTFRLPAPTLIRSHCALEQRVTGLLASDRCVTVRLKRRHVAMIASAFGGAGLIFGCLGIKPPVASPPPVAASDPAYNIQFETGASRFLEGDDITVTKVTGDADGISPGHTYNIEGTYRLSSHARATLAVFTTAKRAEDGAGRYQETQAMIVNKGSGTFTLLLPMSIEGWPHVSFYPAGGGDGFGGRYFGTGETVLK